MHNTFAPLEKQNESAQRSLLFSLVEPQVGLEPFAKLRFPIIYAFLEQKKWSRKSDLNRRPAAYKAAALPTELLRRSVIISYFYVIMKSWI